MQSDLRVKRNSWHSLSVTHFTWDLGLFLHTYISLGSELVGSQDHLLSFFLTLAAGIVPAMKQGD